MKTHHSFIYITLLSLLGVRHMALAATQKNDVTFFDTVSAKAMRANLRFLASDELKGRDTPSPELDIAAAWIASQFEQAGLEPIGKDGYFQVTNFREKPVRNVIGVLKGSDPKLAETYVIVSAHYDHIGVRGTEGDTIYNGANDDGSGTVAVVELAKAFGAMKTKPKRSIVFMCFWGEEKGLLGSSYYGKNPAVPLAQTVGMINLEQIGRTDDSQGPQVSRFALTGYDYTDIPATLKAAGKKVGVEVDSRPEGNSYFMRSDNAALAGVGIPAHTVSVAYSYPDYHRAGDHWDKIDYDNMAKVAKAVGLGVLAIANAAKEPAWNESNPSTKRYIEAWKKLKG